MKNNEHKENLKKYIPALGLTLLTIVLIFYFKTSQDGVKKLYNTSKASLFDFYAENLKPLFFNNELSNEDVYNFAVYHSLKFDSEKGKYLSLKKNDNGRNILFVNNDTKIPKEGSLKHFKKRLNLNLKQEEELDSILDIYKDDLYASVMTNENDVVAITPEIEEIQKYIISDLINFVGKIKSGNISGNKLVRAHYFRKPKFGAKKENFIVLAADTVLYGEIDNSGIDIHAKITKMREDSENGQRKEKYLSELQKLRIKENHALREQYFDHKMSPEIDIPFAVLPREKYRSAVIISDCPQFGAGDSISIYSSDSLTQILASAVNFATNKGVQTAFKISMEVLNDLLNNSSELSDGKLDIEDWSEFGLKIDSLAETYAIDTVRLKHSAENFGEDFKKNMEKFGRSMERWGKKIERENKKKFGRTNKK